MLSFFIDLNCEENLCDGLPFFAAGLIERGYPKNKKALSSGKDFVVSYIDPWGEVQHEWRAIGEVRVINVDEYDFNRLQQAIKEAEYNQALDSTTKSRGESA